MDFSGQDAKAQDSAPRCPEKNTDGIRIEGCHHCNDASKPGRKEGRVSQRLHRGVTNIGDLGIWTFLSAKFVTSPAPMAQNCDIYN